MRNVLLLLLLLPLLTLMGCLDGGTSSTANSGGGIPDGSNGGAANLANIKITLPPQDLNTNKALINPGTLVRNAARLVAVHETVIGQTCPPEFQIISEDCDEDTGECIVEITCQEGQLIDQIGLLAESASDGALAADGSGTLELFVPPGTNYIVHILTYTSGEVTFNEGGVEEADTFVPYDEAEVTAKLNSKNRIVLGANDRNIILAHGTTAPFDIATGEEITLSVNWETLPLAQLDLPVDPILAGDDYEIMFTYKSDALRNDWYVQQLLSPADMASMLFISEGGDIDGTGTSDTITLNTEMNYVLGEGTGGTVATAPEHQIWHFAQFFINSDLLVLGDSSWTKWIYGTSYAGGINALGSVIVIIP